MVPKCLMEDTESATIRSQPVFHSKRSVPIKPHMKATPGVLKLQAVSYTTLIWERVLETCV